MKKGIRQFFVVTITVIIVAFSWWPIQLFTGSWEITGKILYSIFCVLVALFGILAFAAQDIEPHRSNKW